MIEIEQIYKLDNPADETIYCRIIQVGLSDYCDVMVLKPTNWMGSTWVTGKVVENYNMGHGWILTEISNCLKCNRDNPCKRMEVWCHGCR